MVMAGGFFIQNKGNRPAEPAPRSALRILKSLPRVELRGGCLEDGFWGAVHFAFRPRRHPYDGTVICRHFVIDPCND